MNIPGSVKNVVESLLRRQIISLKTLQRRLEAARKPVEAIVWITWGSAPLKARKALQERSGALDESLLSDLGWVGEDEDLNPHILAIAEVRW